MKSYLKSLFTPTALQQLVKVGLVGVINTAISFTLFNVLLTVLGGTKTVDEGFNWEQFWAIALAFLIATQFFCCYVNIQILDEHAAEFIRRIPQPRRDLSRARRRAGTSGRRPAWRRTSARRRWDS